MANSIKKNFIYNLIYQILLLAFPLITVPYVSRVLGVDGVGVYSFTYSIVYYFMLMSLLGINNHGNRAVAKVREDKNKLSETFFSIYIIQLISSILMVLLYILYLLIFSPEFLPIAQIQMIYIVSAMFDINWFFFGLEEFKLTTLRNIIIKILSVIMIFILVKGPDDVWIYTLILGGSALVSQIVLWPPLFRRIKFTLPNKRAILRHVKPCLVLFIPVIAISLYKVMDKIMLGIMTNVAEVGYYEQAEKITTMPLALVTALGTVIMPRMANLASKGHEEKMREYIGRSIKFMMFLAFPICLGLIAVADNFVPIFLGNEFEKSALLAKLLSVTVLFLAFANILRTGYLIPKERDGDFVVFTLIGAFTNLIINLLLIPRLESFGACIGTVIAEFVVMLYQIYAVKKDLPIRSYIREIMPFAISALAMFLAIAWLPFFDIPKVWCIIIQIVVGMFVYYLLNYRYVKQVFVLRNIMLKFRRRGR